MHIAQSKEALYTTHFKKCLKTFLFGLRCTCMHIYIYIYIYIRERYLFRPSYSNQMALTSNTLTMQSNGLPERLQVCFYRWTCLRGRGSAWRYHCKSWWSPGATWRWGFTTEEADKILTPNSPPPFLHPCQDIFVSSLMTDLNTQLITPLMGIDTLWKKITTLALVFLFACQESAQLHQCLLLFYAQWSRSHLTIIIRAFDFRNVYMAESKDCMWRNRTAGILLLIIKIGSF